MIGTVLTKADIMGFVASEKPDEAKKFYSEILGLELLMDERV
jgi:catechol 2,3-dioxygenase-like lactoylglutathione lyase family enzyme